MVKKILVGLGIAGIMIVAVLALLIYLGSTPLSPEEAQDHLDKHLTKVAKKADGKGFSGVQVLVVSESKGFAYRFAKGQGKRVERLKEDTPYHVASVGKLMTSVMIYQLIEEGHLRLDEAVGPHLIKSGAVSEETLAKLFTYKGVNYTRAVTVRHLLEHTSGVADYFDGPVLSGEAISQMMKADPNRLWQPHELVTFSADRQVPLAPPGEGYAYSDTGFVLLGFLVESVTGQSFEDNLTQRIFKPLGMVDTYMALRQEPLSGRAKPMADLWLEGIELGAVNALSVDWSGGGLVSTLEDLFRFNKGLHGGKLVGQESLKDLFSDKNVFEQGIYTGTGGMTVHFEKFFPLLKLPRINGHIGILGTHVFYDAQSDAHIVMNFGSTEEMVASFMSLIEIMNTMGRIQN